MICRRGFSLVEIVVVVMILGIIAAIVVPRVLHTTALANEKSVEFSAAVVRDAIDLYAATHGGELPGDAGTEADFKSDLEPHLRRFPVNPLKKSDTVKVLSTGKPLSGAVGGPEGWLYDNKSGEFIPNIDPAATAP
jgi:prepilin-type N-terminal cleavage/methylation domain-containing protein